MLDRTFLRLTVLEALRPSALLAEPSPAWPLLAGALVYDSRFDPFDDLGADEFKTAVAVYTEDDERERIAHDGDFYLPIAELVIELAVFGKFRAEGDAYVVGTALADAELEAELDLLEQQVFFQLHAELPENALFRKLGKRPFRSWRSLRGPTTEEGHRLARRTIRAQVELQSLVHDDAPTEPLSGLARLPEPLKSIAAALSGSAYAIAAGIAAKAPAHPVADALQTVALEIDRVVALNVDVAPPDDIEVAPLYDAGAHALDAVNPRLAEEALAELKQETREEDLTVPGDDAPPSLIVPPG